MKKVPVILLIAIVLFSCNSEAPNNKKNNEILISENINMSDNTIKILYIFPHPDDESFGPAPVIYKQLQSGSEVHLLTLTKGGATKVRHKLNLSVAEMGKVRVKEMLEVEKVLGLTSMMILDYPDGEISHTDPKELEVVIKKYIEEIKPNIIVTYPVHGISGHHDHLACHAIVKRLYSDLSSNPAYSYIKRLAFMTMPTSKEDEKAGGNSNLNTSNKKYIDCVIELNSEHLSKLEQALYCYKSYQEVIKEHNPVERIGTKIYFEFYNETFDDPVERLEHGL